MARNLSVQTAVCTYCQVSPSGNTIYNNNNNNDNKQQQLTGFNTNSQSTFQQKIDRAGCFHFKYLTTSIHLFTADLCLDTFSHGGHSTLVGISPEGLKNELGKSKIFTCMGYIYSMPTKNVSKQRSKHMGISGLLKFDLKN
jgi:hypothetical protein